MQQLIYFLNKYKNLIYYLFLLIIAFSMTFNNFNFHRSKFISSTNFFSGSIIEFSSDVSSYMNLKSTNRELAYENMILKNQLTLLNTKEKHAIESIKDSLKHSQKYQYTSGKILKNEFQDVNNYLTINLGEKHTISKEMAVINDRGIIGITDDVTENYGRVQSILNRSSKINARFKNNFYFGTLTWNGNDYNTVQLTDIPRQAIFKKGDTIITGGKSSIFPEGIPIGTIIRVPKKMSAANTLDVKLFNDMSNLGYIYVVTNYHKTEVESLEKNNNEQ